MKVIITLSIVLILTACTPPLTYNSEIEEYAMIEPSPVLEPVIHILTWQEAYSTLLHDYAKQPPLSEWSTRGFILYDIDKNGIPELIITRTDEAFFNAPNRISTEAIYTFREDSVVPIQGGFSTYNSALSPSNNQPGIVVLSHLSTYLLTIEEDRLVAKHILQRPWYWADDPRWFMGSFIDSIEITESEYTEIRNSFVPTWTNSILNESANIWPAEITEANIYDIVLGSELPEFIIHIADYVSRPPIVTIQVTDALQISAALLTGQRFRHEFLDNYDSYVFFSDEDFSNIYDVLEATATTHTTTQLIAFTVNIPVKNFRYFRTNGAEFVYEIPEMLYTLDMLLPEEPFITTWWAAGPHSQFGISFDDESGITRYYALNWDLSGYDTFAFYGFDAVSQ
ncbi:MAG: hypothetical protein FWE05_01890 [Defluviitaleaceae bacterium]|nr:hypothetical protein [Defluviitaleaceae bacterium]